MPTPRTAPRRTAARLVSAETGMNRVSTGELASRSGQGAGRPSAGEYLLQLQRISEDICIQALSMQTGIPLGLSRQCGGERLATRTLPAAVRCRWKGDAVPRGCGQLT